MKCMEDCENIQKPCCESSCRYWIEYKDDLNCSLICVKKNGNLTLKDVAVRLGISHVRVKQIQDKALKKINKKIKEHYNY